MVVKQRLYRALQQTYAVQVGALDGSLHPPTGAPVGTQNDKGLAYRWDPF